MKASSISTRLISLGVLLMLAAFVTLAPLPGRGGGVGETTFCLGFILVFGYYLARMLAASRLPAITSYILVGVACGPFALNLLSTEVIESLRRLDDVALTIIALIAGGEMRLGVLRSRGRAFASVIACQVIFAIIGAVAVTFALRGQLSGLPLGNAGEVIAIGLLLALVTVARSPATTIGVVTELRARGPLTEVLVGVTVLLDVVVLVLAAIVVPVAETLTTSSSFSVAFAQQLTFEVLGSLTVGIVFGYLLRLYIQWVGGYLPLFLLGVGLIGTELCRMYHLSPLLSFMIAGFFVENYSKHGPRMIEGLERSAVPVYVLFFAISGASINLTALQASWLLALALVLTRAAVFYVGSFSASRLSKSLRPYAHTMWSGFLAQAGVTIGIAGIFDRTFAWGGHLETIVLAVVALNQLIGPVALKWLLERVGEVGGMDRRG